MNIGSRREPMFLLKVEPMRALLPCLGASLLAGCATAEMRLPDNLATASRVEFEGIGGSRSGLYRAGAYSGRYARSADRLTVFGTVNEGRGHSEFTLAGGEFPAPVEGRCRMRQSSLDLGLVDVTTRPMAYRCEFSQQGRPMAASLELQEVTRSAINRYERRGRIMLDGETVEVHSVHHLAGTPLPTSTAIGYQFEQHGHPVGAIELNGRPALMIEPGASPALRQALVLGALALGVLWDPANIDT